MDELSKVVEFFEFCNGQEFGFRWKDWTDYKSSPHSKYPAASDQIVGFGDGYNKSFQLVKHYGFGTKSYVRDINKPVLNSVIVAVDENIATSEVDFSIDYSSGKITFVNAPTIGAPISAGFEFDIPVRFQMGEIAISLTHFEAGEIQDIDVREILNWT